MFQKKTVKAFSIVAIVLSSLGILFSIIATLLVRSGIGTLAVIIGIISWAILLWASIIGYQLCSSYELYDEEYKKVGIRIYAIIVAFVLFFFAGIVAGLAISVILLSALWALKKNYDEWDNSDKFMSDPSPGDSTSNN
jgi:multisubunit Na+/H+ antiporter MnhC subunit